MIKAEGEEKGIWGNALKNTIRALRGLRAPQGPWGFPQVCQDRSWQLGPIPLPQPGAGQPGGTGADPALALGISLGTGMGQGQAGMGA